MHQTSNTDQEFSQSTAPAPVVAGTNAASEVLSQSTELSALLSRASGLAVSMGVNLDAWMKSAWSAYVDAQPGLREHLEDMQLLAQLTTLRQTGRLGQA